MDSKDRNEVVQLVRQEIAKQNAASRYQLTPTSTHIHNGIDTPFVYNAIISYVGIIITSNLAATLPVGWTIANLGTGITEVTHNLGELDQMVWLATPIGAGGSTIPVPIVVPGPNVVDFSWFDVSAAGAGAPVDTTFMFVGIQVNNKTFGPTKYSVAQ